MSANIKLSRPTVILDLGGVLVRVNFMRACARLEAAGAAPAAAIHAAIAGGAEKSCFDSGGLSAQEFAAHFCTGIGLQMAYAEFAEIWCDIFAEQREVTEMLDEIAEKADLMLLSNTDPLHFDYLSKRYGFLRKFGQRVLSYEVGHAKPAAQIYQRAMGLCAVGGSMIYFDDVPEYVAAARDCGLPAQQYLDAATLRRDLQRFGVL